MLEPRAREGQGRHGKELRVFGKTRVVLTKKPSVLILRQYES